MTHNTILFPPRIQREDVIGQLLQIVLPSPSSDPMTNELREVLSSPSIWNEITTLHLPSALVSEFFARFQLTFTVSATPLDLVLDLTTRPIHATFFELPPSRLLTPFKSRAERLQEADDLHQMAMQRWQHLIEEHKTKRPAEDTPPATPSGSGKRRRHS